MTDAVAIQLIVTIGACVTSIATLLVALWLKRAVNGHQTAMSSTIAALSAEVARLNSSDPLTGTPTPTPTTRTESAPAVTIKDGLVHVRTETGAKK